MAHNLMRVGNRDAYMGRQAAWHTLGDVRGTYLTFADLMAADSLLAFDVFKDQLEHMGKPIDAWGTFRLDPGATEAIFLGTVGSDYQVIHHSKGFEMVDALIKSKDGAHYETAGALGKGERVWAQADLGLVMRIGGVDEIKSYLSFLTAHDGSMSHQYRTVNTRQVCQNTWAAAVGEKTTAKLVIRHTKNADQRLNEAHDALRYFQDDVSSIEEKLNFLASRKVTRESLASIMDRLFPKTKKEKDGDVVYESSGRRDGMLAEIVRLYEMNDGNVFPQFRGSAYNLLNAVTEFTDHFRNPNGDPKARAESAMFGSGDVLKTKALDLIVMAANKDMPALKYAVHAGGSSTGSSLLDDVAHATIAR